MTRGSIHKRLLATAAVAALLSPATPAWAQPVEDQDAASQPTQGPVEAVEPADDTIVVTGSRIRRSRTDTATPVIAVDQQSLTDRGFVSASDALNQVTSAIPQLSLSTGAGVASGSGQQFPNLFGLGTGRTLTLVNGRRFVTSSESFASAGGGDAQVDANIIPTGLIQRVEIVQAGGAVVYGTDAIAGVVNYILRQDFSGIEVDGQAGISHYGDYPLYSARLTAGQNFGDGRGNIAVNVEWSKSELLGYSARPRSNLSRVTANSGNTNPTDGIPSLREVLDARFPYFNTNGVIFTIPAPVPMPACGNQVCFLRNASGQPVQFTAGGGVAPYNPGTLLNIPFAEGGQGFRFADLASLRSGVERLTGNLLAHYDITDNVTVRGEFLYGNTKGVDQPQFTFQSVLSGAATGAGVIAFTRTNGFLTPEAVAALSAIRPQFAAGAPLFLSKAFPDMLEENVRRFDTKTYRGLVGLEGEFGMSGRDFYWSLSGSYGRVEGTQSGFGIIQTRFNNAINSVRLANGQVVCAINADAVTTNDDPACAPINIFGANSVSPEARAYVNTPTGFSFLNEQYDLLATLGGELFTLPGGTVSFSAAYEHRDESVAFDPFEANRLGTVRPFTQTVAAAGSYNTDEVSGELLVPLVGRDFKLPLVNELELNLAARYVDNSFAGKETLWSIGGRWEVVEGVTLRASRSRNFRAPTLTQLLFPSTTALSSSGLDPCDVDRINQGPAPALRKQNCLALFQANPGYGVGGAANIPAGASAEVRLNNFQDPAENFQVAQVTSGGNPDLKNEISKTLTYGFVLQPTFIPGLTITVDRVEVDLTNGLAPFTNQNFMEACYDNETPPPGVCEAFSRLANPDGSNPGGTIIKGTATTFNAGVEQFRGEVYNVNYVVPESILGANAGRLELGVEATHTSLRRTSVTGATFNRIDGTVLQPDWVGRFDIRYSKGPFRFTYQVLYRDDVLAAEGATVENNPAPFIDENFVHNTSMQYDFGGLILRGGILNLFNTPPSYPTLSYGDILGRQYYVGARVRF